MAVQTTMSSLAARLAGRSFSGANAKHKDKPVNTGFQRLPGGIKNGVAKINSLTIGTFKDDKNGPGTKGMEFFMARAVVVFSGNPGTPTEHRGIRVVNMTTTLHSSIHKMMPFIPLCDMPVKGKRSASKFDDHFYDYTNFFKMVGFECPHTPADDPTSVKTLAYFDVAIKKLLDPAHPVYITFSTSEWTPDLTPEEKAAGKKLEDKEPMLFETWHGKTEWKGIPGPVGGVNVVGSNGAAAHDAPPLVGADGLAIAPPGEEAQSLEDEVQALVAAAYEDDGAASRLTQLAMEQGWTEDEVVSPDTTWERVGEMALSPPEETTEGGAPTVGSKWNYTRRDSSGKKVVDRNRKELPSEEVEVTSVNEADSTCTVRSVKDGKDVMDARTRKPAHVKFEWLE